jgi:hypothetical protein
LLAGAFDRSLQDGDGIADLIHDLRPSRRELLGRKHLGERTLMDLGAGHRHKPQSGQAEQEDASSE